MILVTGNFCRYSVLTTHKPAQGFTLLELLVVLLIIGVIVQITAANLGGTSEANVIRDETRRLEQLLHLANQDAGLRSRLIGVHFSKTGYSFLVHTQVEGKVVWEKLNDAMFRTHALPKNLEIELLEKPKFTFADDTLLVPQVLLSASGEISPFSVRIIGVDKKTHYVLSATYSGAISVNVAKESL